MKLQKWTSGNKSIKIKRDKLKKNGGEDMATISFDKDIILDKQSSEKLLHILSSENKKQVEIADIDVESKIEKGKELLKRLFCR